VKFTHYSKVKSEEYKVKKSKRISNTSKKVLPLRKSLKQRVSKAKNIYQRSHICKQTKFSIRLKSYLQALLLNPSIIRNLE